jgi:UDP-N-acetylmuramate dehydrogenase
LLLLFFSANMIEIKQNIQLKPFNTFGIQALAAYYAIANSVDDIKDILSQPQVKSMPLLVLGGGSNLLLTQNFNGLVLHIKIEGIDLIEETEDYVIIKAGAGETWHQFVQYCIAKNYAGVENLSLIPGSVGAAPMQNIGAYGVEIKETFYALDAIEIATLQPRSFIKEECKFGYRESIFKHEVKGQYIITHVSFKLSKKPSLNTSYGAIETELDAIGVAKGTASIADISRAVINIRSSKLPNPAEIGNAGSFFKNPVVSAEKVAELKAKYPDMPAYPSGENQKLAAGWLIEQCGWKGYRDGDTGVHKNQALVLVNYGNAAGNQVYALSEKVLQSVKEKFGVELEREVNII